LSELAVFHKLDEANWKVGFAVFMWFEGKNEPSEVEVQGNQWLVVPFEDDG